MFGWSGGVELGRRRGRFDGGRQGKAWEGRAGSGFESAGKAVRLGLEFGGKGAWERDGDASGLRLEAEIGAKGFKLGPGLGEFSDVGRNGFWVLDGAQDGIGNDIGLPLPVCAVGTTTDGERV